jgi:hypothetical protein
MLVTLLAMGLIGNKNNQFFIDPPHKISQSLYVNQQK